MKIVDIQERVASISSPEVFAPFGGFADSTPVENGMIGLPDVPGVGFEAKSDLDGSHLLSLRTLAMREAMIMYASRGAFRIFPDEQQTEKGG